MNLDKIVTAKIVSVAMVTTLSLTGRLYVLAWTLLQPITGVARPALAQIYGEGRMQHALDTYRQLLVLNISLALVAAAAILAANQQFVTWWVGRENYGGIYLDGILALNLLVHAWVLPSRAMTSATLSYVKENSISRFFEGLLNLGLSLGLGFVFGLPGIAAATAIAGIVCSSWYLPSLVARIFHCSLRELIGYRIMRISMGLVLASAVALVMQQLPIGEFGFLSALLSGTISAFICVLLLYWMVIGRELREAIFELGNKLMLKIKDTRSY